MAGRLINRAFHRVGADKRGLSVPLTRASRPIDKSIRFAKLARWGTSLAGFLGLAIALSPAYGQDTPADPSASPTPTETPSTPPPTTTPGLRPTLRLGSQGEDVRQLQAMLLLLGFYTDAVDGVYGSSTAIAVADFQEVAGLTPDGIMGNASWSRLLPSFEDVADVAIANPESTPTVPSQDASPAPETTASENQNPAPETPDPAENDPSLESVSDESESDSSEPETPEADSAPESLPESSESSAPEPSSEASEAVDLPILRMGMQGPAVERLQERLQVLGFYTGAIDGVFGEATKSAVETAQRNYDIAPDGVVGPVTWSVLLR